MTDLVKFIVSSIVENPDKVEVTEEINENDEKNMSYHNYHIKVDTSDIGIVIGKGGNTIKSIRNIVKIKAIKNGIYADVKITE